MTLILIFILLIILVPIALFFIFVKKFNGVKEVTIILLSIILIFVTFNYIFKKSDSNIIKEKLHESKFPAIENFKIIKSINEENWDYYYEYELQVTNIDKQKLIDEISKAKNFQKVNKNELDDYFKNKFLNEITPTEIIQNYNIDNLYIRRITFPSSSREFEIKIDSKTNELTILDHYF